MSRRATQSQRNSSQDHFVSATAHYLEEAYQNLHAITVQPGASTGLDKAEQRSLLQMEKIIGKIYRNHVRRQASAEQAATILRANHWSA